MRNFALQRRFRNGEFEVTKPLRIEAFKLRMNGTIKPAKGGVREVGLEDQTEKMKWPFVIGEQYPSCHRSIITIYYLTFVVLGRSDSELHPRRRYLFIYDI